MNKTVRYYNEILLPKSEEIDKYNLGQAVIGKCQTWKFENESTYSTLSKHKMVNRLFDWYMSTEYFKSNEYRCHVKVYKYVTLTIYFQEENSKYACIDVIARPKGIIIKPVFKDASYDKDNEKKINA